MRYLIMFSLTALFLLACGDTDNPVVYTAPAGKATVDNCQDLTELPEGFLAQAQKADPSINADDLLTRWQAHGCADWAFWGLIWQASLNADETFEVEAHTTPAVYEAFREKYSDNETQIRPNVEIDCGPVEVDDMAVTGDPPVNTITTTLAVKRAPGQTVIRDKNLYAFSGVEPEDFVFLGLEVSGPCESEVTFSSKED